jgi:hypothetical protein
MADKINEAAARCREAFENSKIGDYVWCCHHERLYEQLTERAEARIEYILNEKPEHEREVRLNNFRPVIDITALADYKKIQQSAWADYKKIQQSAWADYDKIQQSAWADYKKIQQPALAKLRVLYQNEVPLGTWNGMSIFNE